MQENNSFVITSAKTVCWLGGLGGVLTAWVTLLRGEGTIITTIFYGWAVLLVAAIFFLLKQSARFNFPPAEYRITPLAVSGLLGGIGGSLLYIAAFMTVHTVIGETDFTVAKKLLFTQIGILDFGILTLLTVGSHVAFGQLTRQSQQQSQKN